MSGGIGAATEEALRLVAAGTGTAADLVQAGLFDDLDVTETGALDAPSPLSGGHPLAGALAKRKAGRPPGSRNRRTEATVRWFLSQHRHPLDVLAEAYAMTPAALAEQIGMQQTLLKVWVTVDGEPREAQLIGYDNDTLLEVYKLQLRMAETVLPHVAQRLPQAVQIDAKGALAIHFDGVSLPARGGEAGENPVIEGEVMGLRLPLKSDDQSRTDDQDPD